MGAVRGGERRGCPGESAGVPSGCAGCGRRLTWRCAGAFPAWVRVGAGFRRGRGAAFERVDVVLASERVDAVRAGAAFGRAAAAAPRAGRLALRRWGRVRGSAPSTSVERSSVIGAEIPEVASNLKRIATFYVNLS